MGLLTQVPVAVSDPNNHEAIIDEVEKAICKRIKIKHIRFTEVQTYMFNFISLFL